MTIKCDPPCDPSIGQPLPPVPWPDRRRYDVRRTRSVPLIPREPHTKPAETQTAEVSAGPTVPAVTGLRSGPSDAPNLPADRNGSRVQGELTNAPGEVGGVSFFRTDIPACDFGPCDPNLAQPLPPVPWPDTPPPFFVGMTQEEADLRYVRLNPKEDSNEPVSEGIPILSPERD